LTPEGLGASFITAGTLNAANIAIMNVDEPVFRWDAFGLTAFEAEWSENGIITNTDYTKFVRFDKCGLYGISNKDGRSWKPLGKNPVEQVMQDATFALTWQGLKVSGEKGVTALIGKDKDNIIRIFKEEGQDIFVVNTDGSSKIAGWTIAPGDVTNSGYDTGIFHDVLFGEEGKEKKYRFGMKIAGGSPDQATWYVREF
jgi:hypothetical protein